MSIPKIGLSIFSQYNYKPKNENFQFYYYFNYIILLYYFNYIIIIYYYWGELPHTQLLNVQSHTWRNSQLGQNWRQLGTFQFCRIGRCDRVYNSTKLNSTVAKCSELAKLARTSWNQLSTFEFSRKHDLSARSDSTQLVEFSWVESDRALRTSFNWNVTPYLLTPPSEIVYITNVWNLQIRFHFFCHIFFGAFGNLLPISKLFSIWERYSIDSPQTFSTICMDWCALKKNDCCMSNQYFQIEVTK